MAKSSIVVSRCGIPLTSHNPESLAGFWESHKHKYPYCDTIAPNADRDYINLCKSRAKRMGLSRREYARVKKGLEPLKGQVQARHDKRHLPDLYHVNQNGDRDTIIGLVDSLLYGYEYDGNSPFLSYARDILKQVIADYGEFVAQREYYKHTG